MYVKVDRMGSERPAVTLVWGVQVHVAQTELNSSKKKKKKTCLQ